MMMDSNLDLKLIIVYLKICNVILTLVNELSQLLRNCLHTLAMNTANLDSCLLSVSAKLLSISLSLSQLNLDILSAVFRIRLEIAVIFCISISGSD